MCRLLFLIVGAGLEVEPFTLAGMIDDGRSTAFNFGRNESVIGESECA